MQITTKTIAPYRAPRLAAAVVGCLAGLLLVTASPAWATHTVSWGVGAPDGPRMATSDAPVEFVVRVSLDGEPLASWPMTARVYDADRELVEEIPFSTDSTGTGWVTVQPGAASQTVEICDDDGCVYGEAVIEPAAGDGASDVEADDAPTVTDAVDTDTDSGEAAAPVGDESGDTSSPLLWILLAVIVVAVVAGGVYGRSRRTD